MKQQSRFMKWCETTTLGAATMVIACVAGVAALMAVIVLAAPPASKKAPSIEAAPAERQKDDNLASELIRDRLNPLFVESPRARIINKVIDHAFGDDD